jgi:hypothetical protein
MLQQAVAARTRLPAYVNSEITRLKGAERMATAAEAFRYLSAVASRVGCHRIADILGRGDAHRRPTESPN